MHACARVLHARACRCVYPYDLSPFHLYRDRDKENKLKMGFLGPVKGSGERLFSGHRTIHPFTSPLSPLREILTPCRFRKYISIGGIPDEVIRVSLMNSLPLVESVERIDTTENGTTDSLAEGTNAPNPYARDILFVATNLDSFEADDVRYGYELMVDVCYRQLDPPYYAWLRDKMTQVKKSHDAGRMKTSLFQELRARFNAIHDWAIKHLGEEELLRAVSTLKLDTYTPPSEQTYNHYRSYLSFGSASSPEAKKLWLRLCTQGYAILRTSIFDDVVVIARDENVLMPAKWSDKVTFTLYEVKELIGIDQEALKTVCAGLVILAATQTDKGLGIGPIYGSGFRAAISFRQGMFVYLLPADLASVCKHANLTSIRL